MNSVKTGQKKFSATDQLADSIKLFDLLLNKDSVKSQLVKSFNFNLKSLRFDLIDKKSTNQVYLSDPDKDSVNMIYLYIMHLEFKLQYLSNLCTYPLPDDCQYLTDQFIGLLPTNAEQTNHHVQTAVNEPIIKCEVGSNQQHHQQQQPEPAAPLPQRENSLNDDLTLVEYHSIMNSTPNSFTFHKLDSFCVKKNMNEINFNKENMKTIATTNTNDIKPANEANRREETTTTTATNEKNVPTTFKKIKLNLIKKGDDKFVNIGEVPPETKLAVKRPMKSSDSQEMMNQLIQKRNRFYDSPIELEPNEKPFDLPDDHSLLFTQDLVKSLSLSDLNFLNIPLESPTSRNRMFDELIDTFKP